MRAAVCTVAELTWISWILYLQVTDKEGTRQNEWGRSTAGACRQEVDNPPCVSVVPALEHSGTLAHRLNLSKHALGRPEQ